MTRKPPMFAALETQCRKTKPSSLETNKKKWKKSPTCAKQKPAPNVTNSCPNKSKTPITVKRMN